MRRWYDLALRLCRESQHSKRMAAVVVRGGNVLSCGVNRKERYQHAEIRALRKKGDFAGATIFIARDGNRMSRPCDMCLDIIRKAKIRQIVYANWDREVVIESI